MPEDALAPLLFQGISREFQNMLLHNPTSFRKYKNYANHLQALDNRFRQIFQNRIITSVKTFITYAAAAAFRQFTIISPNLFKKN
jgi:hypothetical protein